MKKYITINPHSFIDVITNSSTEIFVCNTDKNITFVKNLVKSLWEDCKKNIQKDINYLEGKTNTPADKIYKKVKKEFNKEQIKTSIDFLKKDLITDINTLEIRGLNDEEQFFVKYRKLIKNKDGRKILSKDIPIKLREEYGFLSEGKYYFDTYDYFDDIKDEHTILVLSCSEFSYIPECLFNAIQNTFKGGRYNF